jgi:hypothetical protein
MELFFYPHAGTGNPTGKILRVRVRVRVSTTRRVRTRCHLDLPLMEGGMAEQCWSGEKEAALVDVLQAVDKKNCHCK